MLCNEITLQMFGNIPNEHNYSAGNIAADIWREILAQRIVSAHVRNGSHFSSGQPRFTFTHSAAGTLPLGADLRRSCYRKLHVHTPLPPAARAPPFEKRVSQRGRSIEYRPIIMLHADRIEYSIAPGSVVILMSLYI